MASGDTLVNYFQFIYYFQTKSLYKYLSSLPNLKLPFLWKEYIFFRTQVYQILERRFTITWALILFYKFSYFKNSRNGKIPLWYYSCLWKLWEYCQRFIKVNVAIFSQKPPTWLWSTFGCKSTNHKIWSMCMCE
jgi:hypothetical protein